MKKNIALFFMLFTALFSTTAIYGASSEETCKRLVMKYATYIAYGNVTGLKQICTTEFVNREFNGMSDKELRSNLLSVPKSKRITLRNDISNSRFNVTVINKSTINVRLINSRTGKQMLFQCKLTTGGWKINGARRY
ncbi:MAG: hypothetical protein J6C44_01695 [Muribaculaceae bacterium]|nr:hypothetical protein [Muribaculaceae bacterium]